MPGTTRQSLALLGALALGVLALGARAGDCGMIPVESVCASYDDCPFGHDCEDGTCVETPCHGPSPYGALPARECPAGFSCTYGDAVDSNQGLGFCEPDPACTSPDHCAWGFACEWGQCAESACHPAAPDGSLPARDCPAPFPCVYGDSIDAGHGNGTCDFGP